MSQYAYKLRAIDGSITSGTLEAGSQAEAAAAVRKLGGTPLSVAEKKQNDLMSNLFKKKMSLKERILFTEELAVMLRAGINLTQGLRGIAQESSNKVIREVVGQMVTDVEGGMQFSAALTKHPKHFSNIYCQIVQSGEKTGSLSDVLERLSHQQQKEADLQGKIRGAMIYPTIVSILMLTVIILVVTFIVPKLTGLFADSDITLPATTQFLLNISKFFTNQWYVAIGAVIAGVVTFKMIVRNPKGRLIFDTYKMKLPVVGKFMLKSYMARMCQNFASLSEAGVPVLEAFGIVRGVVGNARYENEIDRVSKDVENGITISASMRKSKAFPGMVPQLISVGEQSGDLAGIFKTLGGFFEKEVDELAKNLSTALEPIIMLVMGGAIAFILIAVLQPIFALTNAAGGA